MRRRPWWLLLALWACDDASKHAPKPASSEATTPGATPSSATVAATATAATAPTEAPRDETAAKTAAEPPEPQGPPEDMVEIPGGFFLMGARFNLGNPEEKPAHEAIVPTYFMDRHEVTVAEYDACVEDGSCEAPHASFRFCNSKLDDRDDHPVTCVDLHMASAYCEWAGKRLPTEREWEYAASGGAEDRRYSWGDSPPPSKKNNCYYHAGGSCPVESFEPGAFGLYDMTGNAWEWTRSLFVPYPSSGKPVEIEPGRLYVYRGGSWSRRFPKWMRTELRNRYEPDEYSASIGFRCVKVPEPLRCPEKSEAEDGVCRRSEGTPRCEPEFIHDGERCVPDPKGKAAHMASRWPPEDNPAKQNANNAPTPASDAGKGDGGKEVRITRTRTPQHDDDCQQHWPGTPAAYLFEGGHNFPSRKPAISAAGCAPRDMSWNWTSACCPQ